VVLDGVRADAIPLYRLPTLSALLDAGAGTLSAETVSPSVTAAAMTSLVTGVAPATHGVEDDRFGLPRSRRPLEPLPAHLARYRVPTFGFMAALPRAFRGIGLRIAGRLGASVTFGGRGCRDILGHLRPSLDRHALGLWLCHWPDADDAGHASGWTSREYLQALHRLDGAAGDLARSLDAAHDPSTVVIFLADHGGGGRCVRSHNSGHRQDTTIPIVLLGGQVKRGSLPPGTSLLDVPATVPWLFGVPVPASYEGRVLAGALGAPALRAVA
jgi:predicted AlkP superfamily pyrophosphatase or phosphodiesterase